MARGRLRARIDMQAPNVWLRDPVLYRIRHAAHHHTGDKWCIYPLYDFAHGLSDYIEGITHSLCTLEFEVHRPLYDWILESLDLPRPLPHQYEFARLNLTYTVMSKRKLKQLVDEGLVNGWDDPRLPTISGHAAARRDGERAARFCLPNWNHEISVADRGGRARIRDARRVQQDGAAPARGAASDQGRDHQLSRGQKRRNSKPSTIRKIPALARARCRSPASSSSRAPISWRRRRRNISGSSRAAKCA